MAWFLIAGLMAVLFTSVPREHWSQWRQEMAQQHRSYAALSQGNTTQGQETAPPAYGRFHGRTYRYASPYTKPYGHHGFTLFFLLPGLFTLVVGIVVFRLARKYRSLEKSPTQTLRTEYAKGNLNDQDYATRLAALERKE